MSEWTEGMLFPPGLMHEPVVVGEFQVQSDEWLMARRGGIGASDTPSILGADGAFRSALEVWADKRGIFDDEPSEELMELFHFGHKLEPLIADEFRERTGYEVRPEPRTLAHPEYPFMQANLDYWVCIDGKWGPLELKNSSAWVADQWAEEAPIKYQAQCQHQMFVAGADIGCIATLIGGNRFAWALVERSEKFIGGMLQKLQTFWQMVENNEQPVAGALDLDLVKRIAEPDPDKQIELPLDSIHWAAQVQGAKEKIKEWERVKKDAEAKIWQAIGDATEGFLPDGSGSFRVSTVTRKPGVTKGGTFKTLRRVKEKK